METFAQTLSANYDESIALPKVDSLSGFVPKHYTFAGWALAPNGEVIYTDGANVLNLTSNDGETVTLYAVLEAETYEVTAGTTSGFEFSGLDRATYGRDYIVRLADSDSYFYRIEASVAGQKYALIYDDERGGFVLDAEYVTDDVLLSGEKYVADPAVYENVTP